jgi:hypothetical protein
LIRIELLGIFEDGAQRDFVISVVGTLASRHGFEVVIEPRLTSGCRPDYLREHLRLAPSFAGVLIGVDAGKLSRARKIAKLSGECPTTARVLWSVAEPSVEEWLMADACALPDALRELFGPDRVRGARRPNRSSKEATAKQRLRVWVEQLLGAPALRGGVEYATQVAQRVDRSRVGRRRNGDLRELLDRLPRFLRQCV